MRIIPTGRRPGSSLTIFSWACFSCHDDLWLGYAGSEKRCFLHVIEYNPGDYVSVFKCEILCDLLNFSLNIFFIIIIISSLNLLLYGVWIDASYPNFFFLSLVAYKAILTSTTCSLLFQRNVIWHHLPHFILSSQLQFLKTTVFLDLCILVTQKSAVLLDQSAQISMSSGRFLWSSSFFLHGWMFVYVVYVFWICFTCNCTIDSFTSTGSVICKWLLLYVGGTSI